MEQFLPSTLHPVMHQDDKMSSHPIVQKAENPDEINSLFDLISYNKGASVLRQLEGFIGEKDFEQAITEYLNEYKFSNTKTSDLLNTLDGFFRKKNQEHDLKHIMDTWTRQMGYPMVSVKEGQEPNMFILTQKRYLADPDAVSGESPYNYRWYIPVTFKTNLGPHLDVVWFSDTQENVKLRFEDKVEWIKLNNNQVGYYRVNYTQVMWRNLIKLMQQNHTACHPVIVHSNESSYVPWLTAVQCFADIKRRLIHSDTYELFFDFVKELILPMYSTYSWTRNDDLPIIQKLLRSQTLELACQYGHPDARVQARKLFSEWLASPKRNSVEPDLRLLVYYYGLSEASEAEWEAVMKIYMKEDDPQESAKLMRALAAPKDVLLLQKYLNMSWDETVMRKQDYLTLYNYLADNPAGTALIWDYYRDNWPKLVDRFTINSLILGKLIVEITRTFDTHTKLREMEDFFTEYPEAGTGASSRAQAIENVKNNIAWVKRNKDTVHGWLQKHAAKINDIEEHGMS